MEEIRKDVVGYEWLYQVSSKWRVRSVDRIILWKDWVSKPYKWRVLVFKYVYGYCIAHLSKWNKSKYSPIHSLVMQSFIWPRPKGYDINHKDWNKTNNNLLNLEYCTKSYNLKHAIATWLFYPNMVWIQWHKWCACIDEEWKVVMKFDSITDAWKYFNCHRTSINNCILWRKGKIKGYKRIYT